jgi:hypothetical protein
MCSVSLLTYCCPTAGVKRLEMFAPGQEGRKRHEATGIWSPDGEWLPLLAPVVTEGRPESWLCRVEEAMFATTRRHLLKVLEDSKSGWPLWLASALGPAAPRGAALALPLACRVCWGLLAQRGRSTTALRAPFTLLPGHTCARSRQEGALGQGPPGPDDHHRRPDHLDSRVREGAGRPRRGARRAQGAQAQVSGCCCSTARGLAGRCCEPSSSLACLSTCLPPCPPVQVGVLPEQADRHHALPPQQDRAQQGGRPTRLPFTLALRKSHFASSSGCSQTCHPRPPAQVVALITIEVHARDVIEKLGKSGCTSVNDFEWVSQLRFYWDREAAGCVVKQVRGLGAGGQPGCLCSGSCRRCVVACGRRKQILGTWRPAGAVRVQLRLRVPGQQRPPGHHPADRQVRPCPALLCVPAHPCAARQQRVHPAAPALARPAGAT